MTRPADFTAWTAGVLLKIYPTGVPGRVRLSVESVGVVELNEQEMTLVLEQAADMMRNKEGSWIDPDLN